MITRKHCTGTMASLRVVIPAGARAPALRCPLSVPRAYPARIHACRVLGSDVPVPAPAAPLRREALQIFARW